MREKGKRKREREGEKRKSVCMCDKGNSHNLQKTRLSKNNCQKEIHAKTICSHSLWSNCKRKIDAFGKKVTIAQKNDSSLLFVRVVGLKRRDLFFSNNRSDNK